MPKLECWYRTSITRGPNGTITWVTVEQRDFSRPTKLLAIGVSATWIDAMNNLVPYHEPSPFDGIE